MTAFISIYLIVGLPIACYRWYRYCAKLIALHSPLETLDYVIAVSQFPSMWVLWAVFELAALTSTRKSL